MNKRPFKKKKSLAAGYLIIKTIISQQQHFLARLLCKPPFHVKKSRTRRWAWLLMVDTGFFPKDMGASLSRFIVIWKEQVRVLL